MTKKLIFAMMAATMVFATSCENDLDIASASKTSTVSFKIDAPQITSRAYSDGLSATVLQYAVYEGDKELTDLTVTNGEIHGSTTVNLQLVTGNTYSVIFWAANENAPYTVDFANQTMSVDYSAVASNNENYDAFYKYHTFTVNGAQTESIELKRPFAQINVGTNDYDEAKSAGYEPKYSAVTVKSIYNTLNLKDGAVSGEQSVTFGFNAVPQGETFPVDGYDYLAMNYVLVDAEKALVEVEFSYTEDQAANAKTRTVGSVPVQRNYRTNIYGQLFTSDVDVNVTIEPEYDGDINVDAPTPEVKSDAQALAAALTANEEYISVVLGEDVNLPINLLGSQTPGSGEYKLGGADTKNITIDLNGKTLNLTTSYMSAIGAKNADATITIKNGTVTSTGNSAATWNINDVTFANCNYVIENVTFNKEVALSNAGKSVTMNNVTINGTGDYYALWISAKGQAVKVDNLTVNTPGRGIKIDEQYVATPAKVTLDINDATFKTEKKAAIMVKSAAGAEINASNLNINNVAADNVHAVWVDEDAADHADKVIVNGALKMVEISGNAGLNDALKNATEGSTIVLAKGEDYGTITIGELKNVTIKGGTMIFKTDANTKIENVTLQNVDFKYTGITADCGIVVNKDAQIDNLVLEGCTFTGTGAKAGRGLSGLNNNASIEIKNCTFKDLGYPVYAWGSYEALTIEGCTFENIKSWAIMPQSGFDGNLTVTGCTFKDCLGGGLIKAGTLTAGHTFTFTNNIITGCTIAGDHNWFQFNVSAGTSVISGNTKDGVDWTPSAADGLK